MGHARSGADVGLSTEGSDRNPRTVTTDSEGYWRAADLPEGPLTLEVAAAESVIEKVKQRLPSRIPGLKGIGLAEAWAGMIDVTPDAVPVVSESHAQPGLFILTGLSGHGFGIGPGAGRVMADLVMGRSSGHDLNRFRSDRFADGSKIVPGPY